MAPELFDGKSRLSKESDIYALGMVIYEVCRAAFPHKSVLMDHPRRLLHTNNHSPVSAPAPHPRWSSQEGVPRDQ